jgi:predicted ATPase
MPDVPVVSPMADESRVWESVNQFLNSLSRRRRIVLFLDDLHWADASTIGLLGYLVRRAASSSILVLGTTRPMDSRSTGSLLMKALLHEDRLVQVSLSSFSAADTIAVAEQLSPAHHGPLSDWLLRNAEGNPYFLTELVRYVYSSGLLHEDGTLDVEALMSAHILPPTIQNLILSRLIRLSEEARRVLDVAAVVGREFDFELVHRVTSPSEGAPLESRVLDALDELQAAVLIQARGGERFTFDHSLTMEVALQDMGETRSRLLHRRVAETLELVHRKRIDPVAGLIARHFAYGNASERAVPYSFRAGRYAAGLAAWAEAIAFYEQALDAESDDAQRTAIFIALGDARFHKGDFAQASDAFRTAIDLARVRADLPGLELAYLALNQSLLPQARFAEAIALGRELALSGPSELAVCAHFIWGAGLGVESAHPTDAEYHLREAKRLLERQGDYTGGVTLAHITYQLGGVMGQQGKSSEAVVLYREALDLMRENPSALDLLRQIMLFNNLAYHLHLLGDPAAADYARAGIKVAQEKGSLTHLSYLLSTSGEIALAQNDLDAAEKSFAEGLAIAEQVTIPERIAGLTANLGLVAQRRGLTELAQQHLSDALARADQLGVRHLAVRIRLWLAPLLPPLEARNRLREARTIAEESGFSRLLDEIVQLEQELPSG